MNLTHALTIQATTAGFNLDKHCVSALNFASGIKTQKKLLTRLDHAGKSYTEESSGSFEKLEKPVWRPNGRQLNKFKSL